MKYHISIFFLVLSTLLVNAQSDLKIASAKVSFVFVNNDVNGTLSGFNSASVLDMDNIENSKLKGSVKVETISTGNSIRNWSLRRGKYFDADTYPTISFESSSIEKKENDFEVHGKLTIKDITKDITFHFEQKDKQLIGTTSLYSSDYGISIKSDREKNKVLVKLVLQLK